MSKNQYGARDLRDLWRVHVGAHKTGTTHLQQLLEAQADKLLPQGVEVIPYAYSSAGVRLNGRVRGSAARRLQAWVTPLAERVGWRKPNLPFAQFLSGQPLTILSHEDQLGFTQDLLRLHFYGGSERWAVLDRLANRVELEIYLSVRSFDTLYVSAFCEILKPFHDARQRFEARRATLQKSPPSWAELAHRIAARYPTARVHVWRFEDYVADPSYVFKALTGLDMDHATAEVPTKTRSPSPVAIELAEALDPRIAVRTRMKVVQELYNAHPKSRGERIDIFDDNELSWLQELYQKDIDVIARSDQLSLMSP